MFNRIYLTTGLLGVLIMSAGVAGAQERPSPEKQIPDNQWYSLQDYEAIVSDTAEPQTAKRRLFGKKRQTEPKHTRRASEQEPVNSPTASASSSGDGDWMTIDNFESEMRRADDPALPSAQDSLNIPENIPGNPPEKNENNTPKWSSTEAWLDVSEEMQRLGSSTDNAYTYLIPGDNLYIRIAKVPEMSGHHTISDIGTLALPLIGNIRADGQLTSQLERSLEHLYGQSYLRNPDISVTLQARTVGSVTLKGLINVPGEYPVTKVMSLSEALAKGAGVTGETAQRDAVISRMIDNTLRVRRVALDGIRRGGNTGPVIWPGDHITIVKRAELPSMPDLNSAQFPLLDNVLRIGEPLRP